MNASPMLFLVTIAVVAAIVSCAEPSNRTSYRSEPTQASGDAAAGANTGTPSTATPTGTATTPTTTATTTTSAASEAGTYLGVDRAAMFDQLVKTIREIQLVSTTGLARLGTTLDQELARTRKRFETAQTKEDVYHSLLSLKNALHDAHAHWGRPGESPLPAALTPARRAVYIEIRVRAEYLAAGSVRYVIVDAKDASLKDKAIIAVDGKPIAEVERELSEWYRGHSPEGLRMAVASWLGQRANVELPTPAAGTTVKLTVEATGGARQEVSPTWIAAPTGTGLRLTADAACPADDPASAAQTDGETLADYAKRTVEHQGKKYCLYPTTEAKIKLVRFYSFDYADDAAMFEDEEGLLAYLHEQDVDKVIFDVRENGGGNFYGNFFRAFTHGPYRIPTKVLWFSPYYRASSGRIREGNIFLSGYKVDQNTGAYLGPIGPADPPAGFIREIEANPSLEFSSEYPFFCRTEACASAEAAYQGLGILRKIYKAAVITGPNCVSSCDDFVVIMKDNNLAKLAGMPSAAADSPFRHPAALRLADGTNLVLYLTVGKSYRVDGSHTAIEGTPASIDIPVLPKADNRGRYLEDILSKITW